MKICKVDGRCLIVSEDGSIRHITNPMMCDAEPCPQPPDLQKLMMGFARSSDCQRKQVGCILLDTDGGFLAGGFNHGLSGCGSICNFPLVKPRFCGTIHAEVDAINNLLPGAKPKAAFVTYSPCYNCVKALVDVGVEAIAFAEYSSYQDYSMFPHVLFTLF